MLICGYGKDPKNPLPHPTGRTSPHQLTRHRITAEGRVTEAEEVHHINGIRTDNRPDNLMPLSASEHRAIHAKLNAKVDWDAVPAMYESGMTVTAIAKAVGSWDGNVSRQLRKRGIRPIPGERQRTILDSVVVLRLWHEGKRPEAIAVALGVSRTPVEKVLREHGIKPHPTGRPPRAKSSITGNGR